MGSTPADFNERYQKVKTAAVDHRSDDLRLTGLLDRTATLGEFVSAVVITRQRNPDRLAVTDQDYLVKPVDISLLVRKLGRLIADSKRHLQVVRTSTARKDSGDLQPALGV